MIKRSLFVHALILLSIFTYAQEAKLLSGKIIDENTGLAVSYATIEILEKRIGTAANTAGLFSLKLPDDFLNNKLSISALGYHKKEIIIDKNFSIKNCTIILQTKAYILPEVTIRNLSGKTLKLGNLPLKVKEKGGSYFGLPIGFQLAVFMKNPEDFPAIIKSLSYRLLKKIRNQKRADTPFRVRIYKLDTLSGGPGEDLLHNELIVSAPKKGGWFTVDVSEYKIPVPEEGFFVAMEWIYTDDKYFYTYIDKYSDIGKTIKEYGQSLAMYWWNENEVTWEKYPGKPWVKIVIRLPVIGLGLRIPNAAIYCEIRFTED